jgi:hypothetical protein
MMCPVLARADAVITEDFSTDPRQAGWAISGDMNLFKWDATNQTLQVTWDSSQSNSYFYHLLGTVLTRADNFSLAFDLRLDSIGPGADPTKAATFPIAVGFINLPQATSTNFLRGTGIASPDLVEFAYFWDSGFGATAWPTVVGTNGVFNYNDRDDYAILQLNQGDPYRIALSYAAGTQTLLTTITNISSQTGLQLTQLVNTNFTDFRLNALSISSYSDAGQPSAYAGSVLAHGTIDNISATVPVPPLTTVTGAFQNSLWQVQFSSVSGWLYTLQRSSDARTWSDVSAPNAGTGGALILSDSATSAAHAFYRVRAERP